MSPSENNNVKSTQDGEAFTLIRTTEIWQLMANAENRGWAVVNEYAGQVLLSIVSPRGQKNFSFAFKVKESQVRTNSTSSVVLRILIL